MDLKVTRNAGFRFPGNIPHNATYSMLRCLDLTYGASGPGIAAKLLKHFPSLHALRLAIPPTCYDDLKAIIRYCPKLQDLALGDTNDRSGTEDASRPQGQSEGLLSLSIQDVRCDGYTIKRFLKEHGATLQSFEWEQVALYRTPALNFADHPVMLDQLRSLRYHDYLHPDAVILMRWIISHAPNMECVEALNGGVNGTILDDLIDRPVRRISLQWSPPPRHDASEYRFLKHHADIGIAE